MTPLDPCATFRALLSPAHDGELSPREEMSLAQHLEGCASCREARARLFETVAVLRRTPFVAPTADFMDRLEARLEREGAAKLETVAKADLDLANSPTLVVLPSVSSRRRAITTLKAAAVLVCVASSTYMFLEALESRSRNQQLAKNLDPFLPASPTPQPAASPTPGFLPTPEPIAGPEIPVIVTGPASPNPWTIGSSPSPLPEPTPGASPSPTPGASPSPAASPTPLVQSTSRPGEPPAPQPTPSPVRDEKGLANLLAAIFTDPSTPASQRPTMIASLGEFPLRKSYDALASILAGALDARPFARENRRAALEALGALGTEDAARVLANAEAAAEEAPLVAALGRIRAPRGVELLASRAADAPDWSSRVRFLRGLGRGGQPEALRGVAAILRSAKQPWLVRAEAARALGGLGSQAVGSLSKKELVWAISSAVQVPAIRGAAAQGLGALAASGVPGAATDLAQALAKDAHPFVREQCALALGKSGDASCVKPLVDRLDPKLETSRRVRAAAANALVLATGQSRSLEEWRKVLATNAAPPVTPPGKIGQTTVAVARDWVADLATGEGTVFLLDRSGSMSERGKIDLAKRTIMDSLEKLPASPRDPGPRGFSIVFFADAPVAQFPRLVEPTPENVEKARKGIENQKALYARTDLLRAVKVALAIENVDTIVLFTDGLPTLGVRDPDEVVAAVSRENLGRGVRIHVVALEDGTSPLQLDARADAPAGEDPGVALLRRLALDNGGVFVKN